MLGGNAFQDVSAWDGEVGSIAKGKNADLVNFDAKNSVSMLSMAEYDPVTPIFRFSEAADIDTVIINGVVRKRNGRLVEVPVSGGGVERNAVGGKKTSMPWSRTAEEVRKSQKDIHARVEGTVYRAKQEYAPGYVSC
ncbi:hypothetical protein LTR72_000292 [Exophiala xenobiotica]|nr:hypothetical protein LTR92_003002 [Exophiala xenobiotica]KAK5213436.1 hypothetical protein LTR41_001015 [Exophiala xenobiotica]KAK5231112.1 hypothetical protein LTR72_000292 [Exophiala xenobiotica]KAK5255012.1 hypothetical protein LTS06_000796 [Exophiala xenobiotica]KAK5299626.1 hypothetical protein LTR14_001840 [Exophiala xenobiotica]